MKGIVSNIQRASLHDGPGLRTTVFLKGCNMACAWCHNPETIDMAPEILEYPEKCINCGKCDEDCFSGAKVLCGKEYTAKEVVEEALLDKDYYFPDGGITISGGEPLCQPKFTLEILKLAKEAEIHTAIETNLNVPYHILEEILPFIDLIMADLKTYDTVTHKKYTLTPNNLVLENLLKLKNIDKPLIIRTPLIAGINDSPDEIENVAMFLSQFDNLLYYEILPYHALGLSKNSVKNQQSRFSAPTKEQIEELTKIAAKHLKNIYVAGVKKIKTEELTRV